MKRILLCLLLVGCASKPAAIAPVALKCLGPDPEPPAYRYGDGPYPGETQAAKLLAADLVEAKGYIVEIKAQMAGCR